MSTTAPTFRPIQPDDLPFLYAVYASTRLDELAPLGWSVEQQTAFLTQQFLAQHQYYQSVFADAAFLLILRDDQAIGRIYIARRPEHIILIDIALLPEYRNQGLGTPILEDLLAEAATTGRPVQIHVEKFNPALRLYERLGFTRVDDRGVYWFMEWHPHH